MQRISDHTPIVQYEKDCNAIEQNFATFQSLLLQAKAAMQQGKYDAAAVYGQIAASYAQSNHCGFFTSSELEQLLLTIGQRTIPAHLYKRRLLSDNPKNILHVSSITSTYGGIPRLIWRWIQQDGLRSHSVALTKHAPNEVPRNLKDAVSQRQGKIYLLNQKPGGLITRAKRLRECAASADVVVLHTWEHDVVPTIAFANQEESPPIIYVNHGDHWFWVGTSISDVVANLRESGMRLSQKRRGIEKQRNLLLPTILEPAHRTLSRIEAKRQIGVDENSILLLSVARAVKYKTNDGSTFADAHVKLLKRYQQAMLVVIGPGNHEDWSTAIEQTQGRIRVLGETPDTAAFYQAADIYVDSFPFVSITSLLEAGSYGLPLVSRCPYPSDDCEILSSDMPGLTGNLIQVSDLSSYTDALSNLIENEEFRIFLGEKTKQKIEENHWGRNWQRFLEDVYSEVLSLPETTICFNSKDEMFLGEPDILLPRIHRTDVKQVIEWHLSLLPLQERLKAWFSLGETYGFGKVPINLIMPEWLRSRYHLLRSR